MNCIPVPKKSTSCMTQVLEDMLLRITQVWSSTIFVILDGEKEGKGKRRGGWGREGEGGEEKGRRRGGWGREGEEERVWSEAAWLQ